MTAKQLQFLERCFAREIECALSDAVVPPLVQSRGAVGRVLERDGFIERLEVVLPGRFPVRLSGYVLTHRGRAAYCATC